MARAPSRPTPITVSPSAGGRRRRTRTTERAASVLVPAYNEEQNIAALLRRISAASGVDGWLVDDIILVASGCSDATVERAREVRRDGLAVRIIEQETREGKAAAINLGLSVAHHDLIVLVSGDVLPAPGAVTALLNRFEDPKVGVVGARPVPKNDESS